jgi:hypothetical protein
MLRMCVCMHSRFIENHPIRILEDRPLISEVVLSQYMRAAELATCHMLEDPTSPIQAGGYVVAWPTLYKRGFGVPSHRFVCSLRCSMTLVESLLMAAFMTLCEAYMGMEPHFNMWNYIFHARLLQGSGTEAAMLGNVDLFIRSRLGVDPYFHLLASNPPDGGGGVESMVVSKEQHRHAAPHVHG